jgi:hypothetical protein
MVIEILVGSRERCFAEKLRSELPCTLLIVLQEARDANPLKISPTISTVKDQHHEFQGPDEIIRLSLVPTRAFGWDQIAVGAYFQPPPRCTSGSVALWYIYVAAVSILEAASSFWKGKSKFISLFYDICTCEVMPPVDSKAEVLPRHGSGRSRAHKLPGGCNSWSK